MNPSRVDRRRLLKTAGLAAAGALIAPRSVARAAPAALLPRRALARVNVSWERIIRTVVGLRPGRAIGPWQVAGMFLGASGARQADTSVVAEAIRTTW